MIGPIQFTVETLGVVTSVNDFIAEIFKYRNSIGNRKIWYRGQADKSHGLLPTIGRDQPYAGRTMKFDRDQERELLHRFRRRSYPLIGLALTAGEALFLARHHKLPTRLLDWSANAFVGLYFACISEPTKHGRVWGAVRRETSQDLDAFDLAKQEKEEDLFALLERGKPSIKLLHPFYNSPRIVAQDGVFTVHDDPWQPLESYAKYDFQPKNLDLDRIIQWRVNRNSKPRIIGELSVLGITHRTVYPDLDGIAQSLWETEVLWRAAQQGRRKGDRRRRKRR
jgi:hypothetical protein